MIPLRKSIEEHKPQMVGYIPLYSCISIILPPRVGGKWNCNRRLSISHSSYSAIVWNRITAVHSS